MAHTFPPGRLEAFSDGVFAVIITIMVLELKVPSEEGAAAFIKLAPRLAVYALSFAFIGIYWVNHHMLVHAIRQASPRVLWANLVWLFSASLVPFFTAYVVEHRLDSFSVALYAGCLIFAALCFMLLRVCINIRQKVEGTYTHIDSAIAVKHWMSMAIYVAAIPLAYRWPFVALLILAGITGIWVFPTLGVETCDDEKAPQSRHSR